MRVKCGKSFGEMTPLPGCAQVVVSHNVFIPVDERGYGSGREANANRLEWCKEMGYDFILATVDLTNAPQCKIMRKNGWHWLTCFTSSKTGNEIGLWGKEI